MTCRKNHASCWDTAPAGHGDDPRGMVHGATGPCTDADLPPAPFGSMSSYPWADCAAASPADSPLGGARHAGAYSGPRAHAFGSSPGAGMEVSLFLGAGMDAVYGMPTTPQFKARMLSKYQRRPAWMRLLGDPTLPNIEDVWSVVDSFNSLSAAPGGEYWIRRLADAGIDRYELAELQDALKSEVFDAYRWNHLCDPLLDAVLGPVLSLAASASGDIRVFTTNYDRSVEEYCSYASRGFRCYDGFEYDPQTGRALWSGSVEQPAPYGGNEGGALKALNLFKIHGSLGWKVSQYGPERTAHEARAAGPGYSDAIVYPSGPPKCAYEGLHASIFRGFACGLHASDACVVVGHSLRDGLIAEQLARFVGDGKRLVVVGPDAAASLGNVLHRVAGRRGPAGWAMASASHFVHTCDNGASVHAIQEEIHPETVHGTVAAVRRAIAMPNCLVAAPARGGMRWQGGGI